ncbi:MAG: glycosyltransferase, partial [Ignavibacteriales bacterium]|nr:glycosyltransferase [Ignavibacteriales bacterium]
MNIPDVVLFASFAACAFYVLTILALLRGLKRSAPGTWTDAKPFVSVIVAARNEEENIGRLLKSLTNQSYDSYEVIIVDDRSEDKTTEIVLSYASLHKNVRLLRVSHVGDMPPKKNALEAGIHESKSEILLFTDADCVPPAEWVAEFARVFTDGVGLVAGYSPYDMTLVQGHIQTVRSRLAAAFLAFEELKTALWSAGSIGIGKAWLCTGRNLAYRKSVWLEAGGFESIKHSVSGDDDLFLQHVRRTTSREIRYLSTPAAVVPTLPPRSVRSFIAQRTRHFSAGRYFPLSMQAFFTAFHLSNFSLYAGLVAFLGGAFPAGIMLFALKSVADILFVGLGRRRLRIGTVVSSV